MIWYQIFQQPYPIDERPLKTQTKVSAGVGFFVALFLAFFQPFGLSTWADPMKWWAIAGYGLLTFIIMVLFYIFMRLVSRLFLIEKNWTLGKELITTLAMISIIAMGNYLFNIALGFKRFSGHGLLQTLWYTHAVGIFPTAFSLILNWRNLDHKNKQEALMLNQKVTSDENKESSVGCEIEIKGENEGEHLSLDSFQMLFAKSAENYLDIFYLDNDEVKHKIFRLSLSQMCKQVEGSSLLRCHRSYIVNRQKILKIRGNAQGYFLTLPQINDEIPVSRIYLNQFK